MKDLNSKKRTYKEREQMEKANEEDKEMFTKRLKKAK